MQNSVLNQSQFNTLFDEFSPELDHIAQELKNTGSNLFPHLNRVCESFGHHQQIKANAGIVWDGPSVADVERVLALRFVVTNEGAEFNHDRLVSACVGLSLLAFLQRFHQYLTLKPRILFESGVSGSAAKMVESGCLNGAMAVLDTTGNPLVADGSVAIKTGLVYPLRQTFEVNITHPLMTTNPARASLQTATAMATTWMTQLTTRKIDPANPAIVFFQPDEHTTHINGQVKSVKLSGVILASDKKSFNNVVAKIEATFEGLTNALGVQLDFCVQQNSPALTADPWLNSIVESAASSVLGLGRVVSVQHLNQNHFDFSHYLKILPGTVLYNKSFFPANNGQISNLNLQQTVEHAVSPLLKVLLAVLFGVT